MKVRVTLTTRLPDKTRPTVEHDGNRGSPEIDQDHVPGRIQSRCRYLEVQGVVRTLEKKEGEDKDS